MTKKRTKASPLASVFLAELDRCPETGEKQKLVHVGGAESGYAHLTLITRGKTTAWKHTIITEEVDPETAIQP